MANLQQNDLPESPLARANIISKIFLWWLNGLFLKGAKRDLEIRDLYQANPDDKSKLLGDRLTLEWDRELAKCEGDDVSESKTSRLPSSPLKPMLRMAIIRQFGMESMSFGILLLFEECFIRIAQPLSLGYLIKYFNNREDYKQWEGYLYATACVLLAGAYGVTHNFYGLGTQQLGMNIRTACCSLIYRKALRLSQCSLGKTNMGQLTNLLSNDVSRWDQSIPYLNYLWVGPIQTAIVMYILWGFYGPACLAGLLVLGLCVLFQGYSGKLSSRLRTNTAVLTDKRIRIMNELLGGIRVIKMYTWEKPFAAIVDSSRRAEVKWIRKTSRLRSLIAVLSSTSSKIIMFVTLFTYVLTGNAITAEKVFVALSLFNTVRVNMTFVFANAVLQLAETLVSIKRLENFLLMEERDPNAQPAPTTFNSIGRVNSTGRIIDVETVIQNETATRSNGIRIKNLTARWNPNQSESTLTNITLEVNQGEILAVIGHVGCGKSSLLQAILKELPASLSSCGSITMNGRIAYAPQEPWVFGGNIKENILFGREYNLEWYDRVVDACSLKRDLELLPHGDQTSVGERGVCLSGGQKARISLARAVYSNADIYLLDDPLSAVDSKVGKHIFEKCICGILANKTTILVTHQLQFLKSVQDIVLLEGGVVKASGKFSELLSTSDDFAKLLSSDVEAESHHSSPDDGSESAPNSDFNKDEDNNIDEVPPSQTNGMDPTGGDPGRGSEESMKSGAIKLSSYWKYFRAGSGYFGLLSMVFLNILTQVLLSGADWWLSFWTNTQEEDYTPPVNSTNPLYPLYSNSKIQLYTYSGIISGLLLCALVRTWLYFRICMNASVNLHDWMFKGIIGAPLRFFDVNPAGRLLNRVSKDIGSIDDLLPVTSFDMLDIFLALLGILVIISMANPILLAPATFLLIISYFLRGFYLKTARSVKRLEGVARSPVFSHLKTSLDGLTTIRAFGAEDDFCKQFDNFQDMHTSSWYLSIVTIRWVAIWLNWIFVLFVGVVTFGLILLSNSVEGAQVGLVVSSVMMLTGMLQWGVKQSADVESQMISVERVLEYTKIPPEPPLESSEDNIPPTDWPMNGEIVMINVNLSYSPEDAPVLKGISIVFKSKEKIGIVGRTGAGKTSIIAALFRLCEPITGIIEIDGVNILQIGLHDLRSKISIIPQDPVLFTGSLRRNLDPFDEYKDEEIWRILEEIQLANEVKPHAPGLMMEVAEGGSNFSVGQRQLICLGRAMLRKNKILVMDEATANLDNETDALIQRTIRTKFADCTVLTVAHRLHTVMDSDKILVLDAGRVKEYDEPHALLRDPSSALHSLVEQTGPATADMLHEMARNAHQ